jgi:hypothetical protein
MNNNIQEDSISNKLKNLKDLDSYKAIVGNTIIEFYWEKYFDTVANTLKQWYKNDAASIKDEKTDLYVVLSRKKYLETIESKIDYSIIDSWAWSGILFDINTQQKVLICSPKITLKKKLIKILPNTFFRFLNPLAANFWELQTGYLLYHIILKTIHLVLITKRKTLIHSAALSNNNNEAIIIAGKGGIGKTITSAYFYAKGGWKIIADDFVVVAEDCWVSDTYLPAHLYGYHQQYFIKLGISENTIFKNRLDKFHWKLYSILWSQGGVLRRFPLPDKVRNFNAAKIKFFFLVHVSDEEIKNPVFMEINAPEAAKECVEYTFAELNYNLNNKFEEKLLQQNKQLSIDIIQNALKNVKCYQLIIGKEKTGNFLSEMIWAKCNTPQKSDQGLS